MTRTFTFARFDLPLNNKSPGLLLHSTRGTQDEQGTMVRIITAAALILVASSAFAASPHGSQYSTRHDPLMGYSASDPTVVSTAGAYVGRDPDPNIRAELRRFPGPYVSGGF